VGGEGRRGFDGGGRALLAGLCEGVLKGEVRVYVYLWLRSRRVERRSGGMNGGGV
jgi:hypothetical protein